MNTTATAVKEPPPPPRIRSLVEDDRITLEGTRNQHPAVITLPSVAAIDQFYQTPGAYLAGAEAFVSPNQLVHVTDDGGTTYSQGWITMVRPHVGMASAVELLRKPLGEALPTIAADGWSFAYLGVAKGWCVSKNGVVRIANLTTEHAARNEMNRQIENDRNRR